MGLSRLRFSKTSSDRRVSFSLIFWRSPVFSTPISARNLWISTSGRRNARISGSPRSGRLARSASGWRSLRGTIPGTDRLPPPRKPSYQSGGTYQQDAATRPGSTFKGRGADQAGWFRFQQAPSSCESLRSGRHLRKPAISVGIDRRRAVPHVLASLLAHTGGGLTHRPNLEPPESLPHPGGSTRFGDMGFGK